MNYCDLHCDTPYELYARGEKLRGNALNITREKIGIFSKYVQLAAYCAPADDSDEEAFEKFFRVQSYFQNEVDENGFRICKNSSELSESVRKSVPAFILTVEDARILCGSLSRLDTLYDAGVRVMTPLWGGVTCIGGSHESGEGLTPFGRDMMRACAKLGIITDISHASERSADDIINIAVKYGMPVIASHSDSYALNPHSRNLCDSRLRDIVRTGGIVGVNLYPPHLTGTSASLHDAVRHILHFIEVVGESHVALGCDFDGMGIFTSGGEDVSCIPALEHELRSCGIDENTCQKILFQNAFDFLIKHL